MAALGWVGPHARWVLLHCASGGVWCVVCDVDGDPDGDAVGERVGLADGDAVGEWVGLMVGETVGQ